MPKIAHALPAAALALALALSGLARAQPPAAAPATTASFAPELAQQLQRLASEGAGASLGGSHKPPRIEVELGRLDPRLKLAPCQQIQPYLPTGTRPWGATRVGLRCVQGATRWNVYLPVTVKLFAPALVAAAALPAGTVLQPQHLQLAEVDLAASADPALTHPPLALGRTLARPLAAGDTLRRGALQARQFFAAGDMVRLVAVGAGYAVSADAQALGVGIEGRPVRVRVESGRILSGLPTADRRVELAL